MTNELLDLRRRIDQCDESLLKLFQERLNIVAHVAKYKQEHSMPIFDAQREEEILRRYEGLEREFFRSLMALSRRKQSKILFPYNIVLAGFMGVGKSSVGRVLAGHLGRDFLDLDEEIEKDIGMTISEFFSKEGEQAFREKEKELIRKFSSQSELVLSVGGGAVLNRENVAELKKRGRLILLTADVDTIFERLKDDTTRPVLGIPVTKAKIEELMDKRGEAYERAAQIIVSTDGLSQDGVVNRIIQSLFQFKN
ncbi:MAG: shikimate kinase [Bacillota bacterium]|nr:shikimate kinase [Bacillota bacterium]